MVGSSQPVLVEPQEERGEKKQEEKELVPTPEVLTVSGEKEACVLTPMGRLPEGWPWRAGAEGPCRPGVGGAAQAGGWEGQPLFSSVGGLS